MTGFVPAMLFWVLIGGMTAAAVILLLRPLLRGPTEPDRDGAPDLAIYRDQLAEIERDLAQGTLSREEADTARLEVERRLLAVAARPEVPSAPPRRQRWTAAALTVSLPLAALAAYLTLGAPALVDAPPPRQAAGEPPADATEMAALVDELAQRLSDSPDDPQGWLLLGRSFGTLGRYRDAAAAFEQAIAYGAAGPAVQSAYGEALTAAADGQVTARASTAFEAALAADPGDPRARFYLALARAQAGKLDEALEMWVALEAETPADAPWRPIVSAQIDRVARQLGRDPEALPGRVAATAPAGTAADGADAPPALSAEAMQAAQAMSPEEREAYVRSMVDGLAARLEQEPENLEGWLQLARSYEVLGAPDRARDAWRRAAALAPTQVDVQLGYATALLGARTGPDAPLPKAFGETVERVRALDPDNPLGLYFAGLAAAEAGDAATARTLWTQVLARLPEGSAERADLQRRIDALEAGS